MKKYFLLSIGLFFLFNCKKKNEDVYHSLKIDTIYPMAYFPAYPGSHWRYITNNGDTVTFTTDPTYVKNSFAYGDAQTGIFQTAPTYVPKWHGYGTGFSSLFTTDSSYVYGNVLVGGNLFISKILSFRTGEEWELVSSGRYAEEIKRKVMNADTVFTVLGINYNHVIVMEDFAPYAYQSPFITKSYYGQDVGLIQQESISDTTLRLLDYYINH